MLKKILMLMLAFIMVVSFIGLGEEKASAEEKIDFERTVETDRLRVPAPEGWEVYTDTNDIRQLIPNPQQAEMAEVLVRDENHIHKYNQAVQEENMDKMVKYYPTYYMVLVRKFDVDISNKMRMAVTENMEKQLDEQGLDYEIIKNSIVENKNDQQKGSHFGYMAGNIINLNTIYNYDNYMVTFIGNTINNRWLTAESLYQNSKEIKILF